MCIYISTIHTKPSQAFPLVINSVGTSGAFFLCSAAAASGAVFTHLFIPLTKDKSMYQLEMLFAKLPDVCDESCIRRRREVAERFSYGLHRISYSYCKV